MRNGKNEQQPADRNGEQRRVVVLGDWPVVRTSETIAAARRQVRDLVARAAGCAEVGADAELMASELLTNAVQHGGGEKIHVRVQANGLTVRVEIRDSGHGPHEPSPSAEPLGERGRGLLLVAALSQRWGLEHDGDATTAWFEIHPAGWMEQP